MAERMRLMDLGQIYGDAAAIQGQRQRNALAELAMPYKVESARLDTENKGMRNKLAELTMGDQVQQSQQTTQLNDLKLTDSQRQQALYESQLFMRNLGQDFEQLPPEQQQQRWMTARQNAIELDPDDAALPEQFDSGAYRKIAATASMAEPKQTSFENKLVNAGYTPGTPEYQEAARKLLYKPSGTTVNLNTGDGYSADRGEFLKALGKKQADQWLAQSELAQQSDSNIAKAEEMLGILNRGLETGALAPLSSGINKFSQSAFGYNLTGLDPAEAERFEAISNQLAKQLRVPGEGVMTDKDFEIYRASTANLGATPQANRLAINSFVRAQRRNQEKAEQMDQWIKENGSMTGFQGYWNRYMTENPLYSEQEAARIRQMSGGGGSAGQILDDDTEAMLQELGV
ncbi:MAG: hypothetical protein ABGX84_06945 [Alcanivorax sp.]